MTLRQGTRLLAPWLLTLAGLAHAGGTLDSFTAAAQHRHLYPIGGGYETALEGYAREVMRHAHGPSIDIVMLPAAFADDPVLPEDPIILAEDVQALQAACDAVLARSAVAKARFAAGCKVSSAPLYVASDAHHPAILAALSDAALDGVFFTGGLQDYAMRILAGTPTEAILSNLADRGIVVGGTSAGAAIESRVMNAGYTDWGDSTTALQKGAIDMWMAQADGKRGLDFGSTRLVVDEHVYSRGRLGRMLNAAAQTVDAFGQGGLLGLGLDYDTGVPVREDRWLGNVAGVSSAVVVDLRSSGATHRWVGANTALSIRRALTHLLPPSRALGFDLVQRTPLLAGMPLRWHPALTLPLPKPSAAHPAAVMVSGDASADLSGPVLREFVARAAARNDAHAGRGPILVVAAAYADDADAQAAADQYAQAMAGAGWRGAVRGIVFHPGLLDARQFADAAGVLFVGGTQALLPAVLSDTAFRASVAQALRHADVVMFDQAMACASGDHYDAAPGGDTQDDAIAAFRAGNTVLKPGLGVVRGAAFEPRLQTERRWGRLYGLGAQRKAWPAYGVSESTAIVLARGRSTVVGTNPVVVLDARRALFAKGDNGALAAFNVLLDVYEPGEVLGR
mgnify:CR=1 FL=1